jgi:SAM-dependent methyltransferase
LEQLTAGLDRFEEVSTQARMGARLAGEMRESPAMWNLDLDLFEEDGRTVYGYRRGGGTDAGGYRSFEDIFRGPEELIREMQEPYVDLLAAHQPVLDAGCGRGEMLGLLGDRGIQASGVDFDASMVETARAHGYEVAQADALDHLEQLEDGSLGSIFSAQFIEHLPHDKLERFLELSRQKLRTGGLLISETVNPHSPQALKMFWTDPSHAHPIFPEVALALCRISGFGSAFAFHPGGSGDYEKDRAEQGSYAVVARKGPEAEG